MSTEMSQTGKKKEKKSGRNRTEYPRTVGKLPKL